MVIEGSVSCCDAGQRRAETGRFSCLFSGLVKNQELCDYKQNLLEAWVWHGVYDSKCQPFVKFGLPGILGTYPSVLSSILWSFPMCHLCKCYHRPPWLEEPTRCAPPSSRVQADETNVMWPSHWHRSSPSEWELERNKVIHNRFIFTEPVRIGPVIC